jgi:hypothetical protein
LAGGALLFGEGLQPSFQGQKVHHGEDPQIIEHCGQHRHLDDLEVGDPCHLGHYEDPGPHYGGHDLAACSRDGLYGRRLLGGVPVALHKRDGKTPRGVHVGNCASAHAPVKGAGYDRYLGCPSPGPPCYPDSEIHQEIPYPGRCHHRGKEDIDEKDLGRYASEKPEYAVIPREIEDLHCPVQRETLEVEHARPELARHQVNQGH